MVKLAILWHMHQPYYEDLATGEHILPWVRLHAIKDYFGMVALLDEFPGLRVTFNLVPSLLVQVQAFAEDRAKDRHLAVGLKPADRLDEDERAFLIANGFHAPLDRMIRPFRRYMALFERRRHPESFDIGDLRDLQVWHKLAWMDPDWLKTDPRLLQLIEKGRDFTEADKLVLRDVELELLRRVIPAYQRAAGAGQIEVSTSPFYHPILPLLCDIDTHRRAHPHTALPQALFKWPSDAREQLARAVHLHTSLFGSPPRGIWPSEGSVSDEAIALLAETGCSWIATDEAILARSLSANLTAEALYRPYEVGPAQAPVRCLFRDHELSDLIGFSYQSWEATAAADDFVRRIHASGRRFQESGGGGEPVVSVILDGENAWEHYPGGGRPFLRALYARLVADRDITTVTMAEAAAETPRRLESVFPGSWINSDFYIWAGHADDHRAWMQLAAARAEFELRGAIVPPADRARALEELLIAEGSDWFWWYGDDHSSDHDREFDDLFRRHARNVYRALGAVAPDNLYVTNITTDVVPGPLVPRTFIDPTIDGEVTGFAEWAGAVAASLGSGGGTMHRVASELVREVRIGASRTELFLRMDGDVLARGLAERRLGLALLAGNGSAPRRLELLPRNEAQARIAVGSIVEAALPLGDLTAGGGRRLSLSLLITDALGHVIEQHPSSALEIELPTGDPDVINWAI